MTVEPHLSTHGIECSLCRMWCHRKCDGLSVTDYQRLSHCDDEWFCHHCSLLSFSTSCFDTSGGDSLLSLSDLSSVTLMVQHPPISSHPQVCHRQFCVCFLMLVVLLINVWISYHLSPQGRIQGGLWGLMTPPSEIYQGSQKSDVLA